MTTTSAASMTGLVKRYQGTGATVEALRGIDLEIGNGTFLAVMGASGSGKSTLLHLLAGLDRPDGGRVVVAGQDLGALDDHRASVFRRQKLGIVFQSFNLLPVLTARENVALPLLLDGMGRNQALERASAILAEVGLGDRGDHRPDQLSGGEQQRVAFARAVVGDPSMILADEPTGNLDSVAAAHIADLLRNLHQRGRTVVMITHEAKLASIAEDVVILADGRIRGRLTDDRIRDPAKLALAYLDLVAAEPV